MEKKKNDKIKDVKRERVFYDKKTSTYMIAIKDVNGCSFRFFNNNFECDSLELCSINYYNTVLSIHIADGYKELLPCQQD